MGDVQVRVLDEDEWRLYRQARLAALEEAPEAFVARVGDEAPRGDQFWRERMTRAVRIVAERGDDLVGLACLALHDEDPETGEVFGLWTAAAARRERVAWELVAAAAARAAGHGCRRLYFWVGCDNVAAIGFASAFGFRPSEERWPVPGADGVPEEGGDEVAMVLSLAPDPRQSPYPCLG